MVRSRLAVTRAAPAGGALAVALACTVLALGPEGFPASADARSRGPAAEHPPPLLLLIPGGGFVLRAETMPIAASGIGREMGFAVRTVRYRLNDPLTAWRQVRDLARRARANRRDVYAYGESAGGTLAALLAGRGLAVAAATNAPPSDLTRWRLPGYPHYWQRMENGGPRKRRALSPALRPTRGPVLVQHSETDTVVPASMSAAWARRDPRVTVSGYAGHHVVGKDLAAYPGLVREGLAFLAERRAGREARRH